MRKYISSTLILLLFILSAYFGLIKNDIRFLKVFYFLVYLEFILVFIANFTVHSKSWKETESAICNKYFIYFCRLVFAIIGLYLIGNAFWWTGIIVFVSIFLKFSLTNERIKKLNATKGLND